LRKLDLLSCLYHNEGANKVQQIFIDFDKVLLKV